VLGALAVAACAPPPTEPEVERMPALAAEIQALGPGVDPEESRRAARVAFERTTELARAYEITDPPLVHNAKVNMGLKPRGLCWQWADDMESRLAQEEFRTRVLHRAIANWDNDLLIDHSTVIISARGDSMFDGIVLDPWRKGGRQTFVQTDEDPRYDWTPRAQVFAARADQ